MQIISRKFSEYKSKEVSDFIKEKSPFDSDNRETSTTTGINPHVDYTKVTERCHSNTHDTFFQINQEKNIRNF